MIIPVVYNIIIWYGCRLLQHKYVCIGFDSYSNLHRTRRDIIFEIPLPTRNIIHTIDQKIIPKKIFTDSTLSIRRRTMTMKWLFICVNRNVNQFIFIYIHILYHPFGVLTWLVILLIIMCDEYFTGVQYIIIYR